ncbi:MAG: TIGR00266 family protein [Deltaproteobacteria bacterium]|nr:TIGR00266 family protein [Deltaproteobacteria bacterium]
MHVEIRDRPSFAHLAVTLTPGDKVIAEAGAMASMSSSVQMVAKLAGGLFSAILRRVFGGESMFVNEFTLAPGRSDGQLVLTQATPGDILEVQLKGTTLYAQPGAYIACGPDVKVSLSWAGFTSFIAREGLFRLKLSGSGPVWFGAYGGIIERDIQAEYVVDTSHLVAYEPTVAMKIGLAGGLFSSIFSGEGLVARVSGPGKIYLQSRSVEGLVAWTNQYL